MRVCLKLTKIYTITVCSLVPRPLLPVIHRPENDTGQCYRCRLLSSKLNLAIDIVSTQRLTHAPCCDSRALKVAGSRIGHRY